MTAMEKKDKNLNVPNLRFPEFSGEWEKELLGTTCNVLMCKRILASQTNAECGVPFYKIGTIGDAPDAYISKELFESYRAKYNYPRKGEVMITCAGTVGKAMIFDGEDSYYQDSNIVWIDNPTNKIDNTFLYHFISKVDWSKLNTTTIVRIYNDDLRQLRISYPTLSEQRKISIFLNLLNQRIETQKKIIEDLKKLKDAICNLNVTSGSVLKLGNAGKFVRGLTYSASDVIEDTIGTAVMRSNNISNGDPVNFEELVWVNKTPNHEQILRSGDIVICMANGSSPLVGKASYYVDCGIESATVGAFCGIYRSDNPLTKWLFQSKHYKKHIQRCIQGGNGAIANIYPEDILAISFNIPSGYERVLNILNSLEDKYLLEQKLLCRYLAVKSHLLAQMFI